MSDQDEINAENELDASMRIQELERELAAALAKIAVQDDEIKAMRLGIKELHKSFGCELLDPYGTIWEYSVALKKENDECKVKIVELEGNLRATSDCLKDTNTDRKRYMDACDRMRVKIAELEQTIRDMSEE